MVINQMIEIHRVIEIGCNLTVPKVKVNQLEVCTIGNQSFTALTHTNDV